jgi:hypothetical protein
MFEIAGVQVAGNVVLTNTIHSQEFTPISQMCIQHPPEMFEIAGVQVGGNALLTNMIHNWGFTPISQMCIQHPPEII